MPANEIEQVRMCDRYALGTPGGTRGVNYICERFGRRCAIIRSVRRIRTNVVLFIINVQDCRVRYGQGCGKRFLSEHYDGTGIIEHEANALGGIIGINGDVSAAYFPHGEESNKHFD